MSGTVKVIAQEDINLALGQTLLLYGAVTITSGGLTLNLQGTTNLTLPTSGTLLATSSPGTAGQVLTSNGSSSPPTFQPTNLPTGGVSGQVLTSNGSSSPATFQNPAGGITLAQLTALIAALPTTLPETAGVLWLNGNSLQIS